MKRFTVIPFVLLLVAAMVAQAEEKKGARPAPKPKPKPSAPENGSLSDYYRQRVPDAALVAKGQKPWVLFRIYRSDLTERIDAVHARRAAVR